MAIETHDERPIGADLPGGARFIGTPEGAIPRWAPGDAPAIEDLNDCVACGLCLPHCPTYRLTGDETASPRGRIAAMRAVSDGLADVDGTFANFMDRCLVCRACEDVCPSHVPFGRMMERARAQVEPHRSARSKFARWVGFHWLLPHPAAIRAVAFAQPFVRPFLSKRTRALIPRRGHAFARLPVVTDPATGVEPRGTVALLSGCAQDRWFHGANLATIGVLARNGWRVTVPPTQACCGALAAHNGRLDIARRLIKRAHHAFKDADVVVVNAAGCSAHMKEYGELVPGTDLPVRDLMEFLHDEGLAIQPGPLEVTVAYHDACHALRAQHIHDQPRVVLRRIPGLTLVEVPNGDRCCGAAGIYNVTQPEWSDALGTEKAEFVASTGAAVISSANPGCTMQLRAHLRAIGHTADVVHPVELLDRAYRGA
jgi:glycolate oxidase iron-sulfur subunit